MKNKESYCTLYANTKECKYYPECKNCAYKVEVNESTIFKFSEVSRILTNDRTAIRSSYDGKKYIDAIEELRDFEAEWIQKHKQV